MAKDKIKNTNIKNRSKKGLLKYFNISTKKTKDYPNGIAPGKEIKDTSNNKLDKLVPINFPNDLKKTWEFFEKDFMISNKHNTPEKRQTRDRELRFMVSNGGWMSSATQIYTNETTQSDSQDRIIGIKGTKKGTESYFYKWLNDIGLKNSTIHSLAYDLTVYGNAIYIKSVDLNGAGITQVTAIDQSECKDVIEFQGVRVKQAMKDNQSYITVRDRYDSIKKLSRLFNQEMLTTDYALWYQNFIFGYTIGDNILPPWSVTHFRRQTIESEFYPYGKPMFIESLAPYKSFKTTEMLVDMARPASFPTKVFEIQGSEDMTEGELFQKVNAVRQMYQNITEASKNKDEISVGESIFSVKGFVEFKQFESRMDLNDIADLDAKKKDLIYSTGIPEGIIDTTQSSWGSSGQALLQQSKIVARNVYPSQTTFIENIANDFKIHLMLTGDLQGEDTEFEIYMNYPVIEESSDRMRLKSDSIRLANDILANLGTSLGLDRGEALPSSVVADVFGQYSFLDMEEVGGWVSDYEKNQEIQENYKAILEKIEDEDEKALFIKEAEKFKAIKHSFLRKLNYGKVNQKLTEKIDERLSEEVVREVYFASKRSNNLTEGVSLSGKHYMLTKNSEQKGSIFNLVKEEKAVKSMKLREEEDNKRD